MWVERLALFRAGLKRPAGNINLNSTSALPVIVETDFSSNHVFYQRLIKRFRLMVIIWSHLQTDRRLLCSLFLSATTEGNESRLLCLLYIHHTSSCTLAKRECAANYCEENASETSAQKINLNNQIMHHKRVMLSRSGVLLKC